MQDIKFKSGDIILFKAFNNPNSMATGLFFTHMGMVYEKDNVLYLFETNGVEHMYLTKELYKENGVFCTELLPRLQKYKGKVYYKSLITPLNTQQMIDFESFIKFADENMYYDTNIFIEALRKAFGDTCKKNTNCGQLLYLLLIKLQLLDASYYDKAIMRHTKFVADFENNIYEPIIELCEVPFGKALVADVVC